MLKSIPRYHSIILAIYHSNDVFYVSNISFLYVFCFQRENPRMVQQSFRTSLRRPSRPYPELLPANPRRGPRDQNMSLITLYLRNRPEDLTSERQVLRYSWKHLWLLHSGENHQRTGVPYFVDLWYLILIIIIIICMIIIVFFKRTWSYTMYRMPKLLSASGKHAFY